MHACYFGWMENRDQYDIEEEYKVYASQLPQVAEELWKLLKVSETLAYKKNLQIPKEFKDFSDRVRFGVTEEELPLRRLRGIGRESTRKIKRYCDNFLRKPPWNYKGTIMEIFQEIYKKEGEKRFVEIVQYVKGIGKGKKLEKILGLVKSKVNKNI